MLLLSSCWILPRASPAQKFGKWKRISVPAPEILSCCNGFIRLCPQRYDKEILPTRQSGGCVEQVLPASMEDSLQEIAAIIRETLPGQTVGILYRNHLSAGPAALWLEKEHIPFQIDPAAFILGRGPVRMQQILLQLAANPGDLEAFRQLRFHGNWKPLCFRMSCCERTERKMFHSCYGIRRNALPTAAPHENWPTRWRPAKPFLHSKRWNFGASHRSGCTATKTG